MYSLSGYKEFNPGMDFPSMTNFFTPQPYEGLEEIVRYLESGTVTYVSAGVAKDAFTGERISGEHTGMTDGEYAWNSSLPYYVRKYNLRLPEVFEKKVLNK